jgi:hypothetical protein
MYTDGLVTIESADNAENAAATASATTYGNGIALNQSTDVEIHFPGGATVEDFLVYPRSAAGGADATRPVWSLHTGSAAGGASTERVTVTAAASTARGARIKSSSSSLPLNIPAGGYLKFVKKTAAGAGATNWRCQVIVRNNGKAVGDGTAAAPGSGTNSPLTSVAS